MAVNLSPVGGVAAQFFDNDGNVLSGGKIYTYSAGTSTPATVYTSSNGSIAHSNPIILDSAGRVPTGEIWLTDGINYKFVLNNSSGTLIATYDNISGINSNFISFTNSQEIQTATSGQTVFTLTTMQYQVGTNSLSVFVDGVNQYGPSASYAYTETSSTSVTFTNGLHVGAVVKFTSTQQQGAGAVDASQVTYKPPFTGSVTTNVEVKLSQYVNVKDFGAVGNGVTNDTAAFTAAQLACKNVYIPPGDYALANLRIYDGVQLIGGGQQNTILRQLNTGDYVIRCVSDATTGQLAGLNLSGFKVVGKTGATVAAVLVYAAGAYAIWRSNFEFFAKDTQTAINIQGPTAANVFRNNFRITSEGTSSVAVIDNGGVYNTFDLFLTQCGSTALTASSGESEYRIVSDGVIFMDGRGQIAINPTLEYIWGTPGYNAAMYLNGIDQTLINPSVNVTDATSAAKISYAFRAGNKSTFICPYIIGTGIVADPFAATGDNPFTIIGPARSNTTNKMENIWDGTTNGKSLRNVTFVGNVSELTSTVTVSNGKTIQYIAPSSPFNLAVNPNTDACIIEPTGVIASCNISFPASEPYDGQVFAFTFTNAVTTITWTTSAYNYTLIPTTAAAGAKFSMIYRKANTKFYLI